MTNKEESFTLCDTMRSGNNVHLINQHMKQSTGVALQHNVGRGEGGGRGTETCMREMIEAVLLRVTLRVCLFCFCFSVCLGFCFFWGKGVGVWCVCEQILIRTNGNMYVYMLFT